MAAGLQTFANTTQIWNNLVKLSPMVWVEGARVAIEEIQPVMDLYDVDPLDEFNRDYGSIAQSGFGHTIAEGADYIADFNNEGKTLSLSVVKRGAMFTITEDLVDGNKYREIRLGMEDLGAKLYRTRALDATHVQFTFGSSTSYTDFDGLTITNALAKGSEAVYATTHTVASGATFSNQLTDTTIGETGLRNLEDLTISFLDENGIPVTWGLGGKVLVTTVDTGNQHAALRLTTQQWNYNSTNRDINPFSDSRSFGGAYTHLPLWYLSTLANGQPDSTKSKYYYIVDRAISKRCMIFGDHTNPSPMGPFRDIYNAGQLWQSKTRYDIGTLYSQHAAQCPATT